MEDPKVYINVDAFISKLQSWLERWEETPEEYSLTQIGYLLKVPLYVTAILISNMVVTFTTFVGCSKNQSYFEAA